MDSKQNKKAGFMWTQSESRTEGARDPQNEIRSQEGGDQEPALGQPTAGDTRPECEQEKMLNPPTERTQAGGKAGKPPSPSPGSITYLSCDLGSLL